MRNLPIYMLILVCWVYANDVEAAGIWWFTTHMRMSAVASGAQSSQPVVVCHLIPGLPKRQRQLCQMHPDAMLAVMDGAKQAVSECQRQFANHRWNCTTMEKGRILLKLTITFTEGSREAAFVYSIYSAGVVYAVAKACARGEISDCSCDPSAPRLGRRDLMSNPRRKSPPGATSSKSTYGGSGLSANHNFGNGKDEKGFFNWGGCSDNVRYAVKFGRQFLDAENKRTKDARSLMNLHNIKVGRKVLKRSLETQCKCHGVSGSCATRTCWKSLPKFQVMGALLREKYQQALQISGTTDTSGSLKIVADSDKSYNQYSSSTSSVKKSMNVKRKFGISDQDLVFYDLSPDYCTNDVRGGSMGTYGRACNKTSNGSDSCEVLCCGRGYDTKQEIRKEKCHCRFIWCCQVECQTCETLVETYTCKPHNESHYYHNNMLMSASSIKSRKIRKRIRKI